MVLVSFREDMPMFSLENTPTETGKYEKVGPSTALIIFRSKAIRGAFAVGRREYLSKAQHPAPF